MASNRSLRTSWTLAYLAVGVSLSAVGLWILLGSSSHRQPQGSHPGAVAVVPVPAFGPGEFDRHVVGEAMAKCRLGDSDSKVAVLAHGLMLWGPVADRQREPLVGSPLIEQILDNEKYREAYGTRHPLLIRTRYGARFADQRDELTTEERLDRESHVGQLLSILGECGVPLSSPIRTAEGPATLMNVLDDLVANFTLDHELDWSLAALALYLPPRRSWCNKFGTEFTFDQLAEHLLDRPLGQGSPCCGTHTLYTLAILLQVHRQEGILQQSTVGRLTGYLKAARERLIQNQTQDGFWTTDWAAVSDAHPDLGKDGVVQAIWMTGHHLDWMAIVPVDCRVPESGLRRAAEIVCRRTAATDSGQTLANCCYYFHGIRATLRLIRQDGGKSLELPEG
jgi:hypothetical protein